MEIKIHRQKHLSIRMLRPRPFNVYEILHAPLDEVYEKSDKRISLSSKLQDDLKKVSINRLKDLLQVMRGGQSLLSDFSQGNMNKILKIFKKLNINL